MIPVIHAENDKGKREMVPSSFLPLDLNEALRHAGAAASRFGCSVAYRSTAPKDPLRFRSACAPRNQ